MNNILKEINGLVKKAQVGAQQHEIGSLGANWKALKNWIGGQSPSMKCDFFQQVSNDDLKHDMSSIAAPTLVDRIHGTWDGLTGGVNPYGHEDNGEPITAEQYNQNIAAAKPSWAQFVGQGGSVQPAAEKMRKTKPTTVYKVDYTHLLDDPSKVPAPQLVSGN